MSGLVSEKIIFFFRDGPRKGDLTSFQQATITIGRATDSDIAFNSHLDQGVSNHHAVVRFRNLNFELTDSHSTNGTYVNGEHKNFTILKSGDVIRLGALGPEIEVSILSDDSDRTMLDHKHLKLVSAGNDPNVVPSLTDPEVNEKILRIRHFRFIRKTMVVAIGSAAGIAGFMWTLIEGFELTPAGQYFKVALSLITGGVIATLIFAIYHGRPGRQRFQPAELLWMTSVVLLSFGGVYLSWSSG